MLDTLAEAQKAITEAFEEGGMNCPCCGRFVKLYPRHLNAGLAVALIHMARFSRRTGKRWVNISDIKVRGGDYAKLRYWGLIVQAVEQDTRAGARSGTWCVTDLGFSFVDNQYTVCRTAWVYDKQCLLVSGEQVSITDALGKKFDYDELMSGR